MQARDLRCETATVDSIRRIRTWLEREGLVTADVIENPEWFVIASSGSEWIAVGGIEPCGTVGLLRSVVVAPSFRGQGYGQSLCAALEAHARSQGIEQLFLLTTTAEPFFRAIGYRPCDRAAVPEAIRQTAQFDEHCPESAICLQKSLDETTTVSDDTDDHQPNGDGSEQETN